jgi:hypothetical protein
MTYLTYSEFSGAYKEYIADIVKRWLLNDEIIANLYNGHKVTISFHYDSSGGIKLEIRIIKNMGEYQSTITNYLKNNKTEI